MKPPPRLRDDTSAPHALREDLRAFSELPADYDAARGLARLKEAMHPSVQDHVQAANPGRAEPPVGNPFASALSAHGLKLAAVAIITAVGLHWTFASTTNVSHGTRSPKQAEAETEAREVVPRALPTAAAPTEEREANEPANEAQTPAARPARNRPPRSKVVLANSTATEREVTQIARMRKALEEHPEVTLRLADRVAVAFPHGVLEEEREALRVLALARLRRTSEARERAQSFHARYPMSSFTASIRSAVEKP